MEACRRPAVERWAATGEWRHRVAPGVRGRAEVACARPLRLIVTKMVRARQTFWGTLTIVVLATHRAMRRWEARSTASTANVNTHAR